MLNVHFKLYTNGIMLILISWALKHVLVSAALFGGGQGLEGEALQAEKNVQVWNETIDDRVERAELQLEISNAKGDTDKKLDRLDKLNEDISETESDISEEYITAEVEADYSSVKGAAKATNMTKWTLKIKILLDLLKIAGVFMVVMSSMRIVRTPIDSNDSTEGPTRTLAIATVTLVLLGTFVQGILSYLS
jgi:hypothetical protein